MASGDSSARKVVRRSLYHWVFAGNLKLQIVLCGIILLVVVARVLPLEMQKRIVNEAIALRQFDNLLLYCLVYLASVLAASGLKLAINYLQAIIGERAMVAMRKELYHLLVMLPLSFFRRTQPGMIVSSLMTELSTAGTFAGMAVAVPVTNILTLLALAGYLLWLNAELALAILGIYPVIIILIPWLQKKANLANRERVDLSRRVSSQITESATGINEIQVHGAYRIESDKFDHLAELLRKVRVRWSLLRFGIKTTNNFFVSLGPFVIFIFGGYLVMKGELQLGAMVAFLSAQEKLYDPWKELIDFYQLYQDAHVRYARTMEQFNAYPEFAPGATPLLTEPLAGNIVVQNLVFETDEGTRLLDDVSFSLAAGEHMGLVGFSGSGKSTLVQCLAKMYRYNSGTVTIDGHDLNELSKRDIVANIGYISQSPFIFTGTVYDNLVYANRAAGEVTGDGDGNGENWQPPSRDALIHALQQAGLFVDVMRFGLDATIMEDDQQLEKRILRMREAFRRGVGKEIAEYVEFYDPERYLYFAPVADNILFGSFSDKDFNLARLAENQMFCDFLHSCQLFYPLVDLGAEQVRQTVDILSDFAGDESLFTYSPVPSARFTECRELLGRLRNREPKELPDRELTVLLDVALRYSPGLHKTGSLSAEFLARLLQGREAWQRWSNEQAIETFHRYDVEQYIPGQSILNNIFFGQVRNDLPHAQEKINQAIVQLLIEEDCLEEIVGIGMDFRVGSMGDNLSGGQRQKLAIARVLLKEPAILIMDEATSALDNSSQARIQRLQETRWHGRQTVISILHRLDNLHSFDKVAVMKRGRIIEFGSYEELMAQGGVLRELVKGERS